MDGCRDVRAGAPRAAGTLGCGMGRHGKREDLGAVEHRAALGERAGRGGDGDRRARAQAELPLVGEECAAVDHDRARHGDARTGLAEAHHELADHRREELRRRGDRMRTDPRRDPAIDRDHDGRGAVEHGVLPGQDQLAGRGRDQRGHCGGRGGGRATTASGACSTAVAGPPGVATVMAVTPST